MKSRKLYLKPNLLAEPLFNQWYAWSYLISPATAAMYITNWHLKVMQSFVSAPQVHISALKNPEMIGGPFINYDKNRVTEIKALMEKTIKDQAHMLEFAEALKTLDNILTSEAKGYSLEPLYSKVPDILKGYVELVYDLNNNPSIRLIEGLLYKSPYYNQSSQSIALSILKKDERSFVFSTPNLEENDYLHLHLPFKHKGIDELFKMRNIPNDFDFIKESLDVKDKDTNLFLSFFAEEAPQTYPKHSDEFIRIRYFGHACLLIEFKEICLLCDPLISYKHDTGIQRYTYSDLPDIIDYVLITHNHQDHCLLETLLQLRHKIKNVIVPKNNGGGLADPSLKLVLRAIGFENVKEIDEMDSINIEGGAITGLPFLGEHADLNIRTKIAYLLTIKEKSILIGADSNNIESKLYEYIHNYFGDIDVIFLGMECNGAPLSWLYGPLLTKQIPRKMDQSRKLDGSNYEKALEIVKQLNPKGVYVYAMGQEPWLTYLTSIQYTEESFPIIESNKLIEDCRTRGIVAERLFCKKEIFLK